MLIMAVPIVMLFWVGMYIVVLQLYIDATPKGERSLKDLASLFFLLPFHLLNCYKRND